MNPTCSTIYRIVSFGICHVSVFTVCYHTPEIMSHASLTTIYFELFRGKNCLKFFILTIKKMFEPKYMILS